MEPDALTNGFDWEDDEASNGEGVRKLVNRAKVLWPWVIISVGICLFLAVFYLYITPKSYKVTAELLIKDDDNKSVSGSKDMSMLQSLGMMTGASNVDNEQGILQSFTLMQKVVNDLQLNVMYRAEYRFRNKAFFAQDLPFTAHFTHFNEDYLSVKPVAYQVKWDQSGVELSAEKLPTRRAAWGQPLVLEAGTVVFEPQRVAVAPLQGAQLFMTVANRDDVASGYAKGLTAEIPNKNASLINLSLTTDIPRKGEQVLNALIDTYLRSNVEDNNRVADSTIAFINVRLDSVGLELAQIEKQIQHFKEVNDLADMQAQGQALIASASAYDGKLSDAEVQLSVVEALREYMIKNQHHPRIIPASLMVQDGNLASLIQGYNTLLMQRERLLLNYREGSDLARNLDTQIAGLRTELMNGLSSVHQSMEVAVNGIRQKADLMESQIHGVPAKERQYLEYNRQHSIKQELYMFLLQKKEESAISRSSTIANAKIVDAAMAGKNSVAPGGLKILAIAGILGLILPFGIVYIRNLLRFKVLGREDVELATRTPILGEVGHQKGINEYEIIQKDSRNIVAEQFRILRANLQFLLTGTDKKVILLTSSIPGEGKTFASINLASVLAMSGKRVVLMEMDLRKPKIAKYFTPQQHKGFANYIIGVADLADIQVPIPQVEGLTLIPSGSIPPNPTELLLHPRTATLFADLRAQYDYIVIDSPPNQVADAQLLARYADATLYIVRAGVTLRDQLKQIDKLYKGGKMPNMSIVVNDVNYKKNNYYGYHSYITDHVYDEGNKKEVMSFWKRWKQKLFGK